MALTNFMRLTNPRLFMRHGVWCCRSVFLDARIVGHGYTPAQAYADWKEQIETPFWGNTEVVRREASERTQS